MLGAIIGDIVGSRFEWDRIKTKDFEFFMRDCFVTDDSIMTLAVAKAILESKKDPDILRKTVAGHLQKIGRPYPHCGYGGKFYMWMYTDDPKPYNSYGNGAAMRVSPCGFAASSLEEAKMLSKIVTEVTHDHPEGLKGAEAVTLAVFMARQGAGKAEIRRRMERDYYALDFTLDSIRPGYRFNETCQETVPQALAAFLESDSFEDCIRNAVSLGGDSDTLAAIACAVAQAHYGVPPELKEKALGYLDRELLDIYQDWEHLLSVENE